MLTAHGTVEEGAEQRLTCLLFSALDGGPPMLWSTWDLVHLGRPSGPNQMAGTDLWSGSPVGPTSPVGFWVWMTVENWKSLFSIRFLPCALSLAWISQNTSLGKKSIQDLVPELGISSLILQSRLSPNFTLTYWLSKQKLWAPHGLSHRGDRPTKDRPWVPHQIYGSDPWSVGHVGPLSKWFETLPWQGNFGYLLLIWISSLIQDLNSTNWTINLDSSFPNLQGMKLGFHLKIQGSHMFDRPRIFWWKTKKRKEKTLEFSTASKPNSIGSSYNVEKWNSQDLSVFRFPSPRAYFGISTVNKTKQWIPISLFI